MFIPAKPVSFVHKELLVRLQHDKRKVNWFSGHDRVFITPEGVEYWVGSEHDAELKEAGLI